MLWGVKKSNNTGKMKYIFWHLRRCSWLQVWWKKRCLRYKTLGKIPWAFLLGSCLSFRSDTLTTFKFPVIQQQGWQLSYNCKDACCCFVWTWNSSLDDLHQMMAVIAKSKSKISKAARRVLKGVRRLAFSHPTATAKKKTKKKTNREFLSRSHKKILVNGLHDI